MLVNTVKKPLLDGSRRGFILSGSIRYPEQTHSKVILSLSKETLLHFSELSLLPFERTQYRQALCDLTKMKRLKMQGPKSRVALSAYPVIMSPPQAERVEYPNNQKLVGQNPLAVLPYNIILEKLLIERLIF